uniref:Nanos-type domain-containing protein n=1 Tax=viral metagenome TaxID=1070528 RepID=A0A6C0HYK9_9ZZZZ
MSHQSADKKFCGVCKKAGKSEKEYTSHFTRSVPGPKGIIVCPTILLAECSFCHQRGHWANEDFCPALKEKKRQQSDEQIAYAKRKHYLDNLQKQQQVPSKQPKAEDFPALGNAKPAPVNKPTMQYASMAKKEAPIRVEEPSEFTTFTVLKPTNTCVATKTEPKLFQDAVNRGIIGNFDFSIEDAAVDDEDEYDSEDEENYRGWYFTKTKAKAKTQI